MMIIAIKIISIISLSGYRVPLAIKINRICTIKGAQKEGEILK
jgi:hypothetical protein